MTASERAELLEGLGASREKMLETVRGLTPEQWDFRPGEGVWSIGQNVEHVVTVENRIRKAIGKMLTREPDAEQRSDPSKDSAARGIGARQTRIQAPEAVIPKGGVPGPELIEGFAQARAETVRFTETVDGDLRSRTFPHVTLGDLDLFQWLHVLVAHTERHVLQIKEVQEAPGYPAAAVTAAK